MPHLTRKFILALMFTGIIATTSGCVIPVTIDCTPFACTP
jgi:hypothetical protein